MRRTASFTLGRRIVAEVPTKSARALSDVMAREEINATTVVSRALVVYDTLLQHIADGGKVIFEKNGKSEIIRFI